MKNKTSTKMDDYFKEIVSEILTLNYKDENPRTIWKDGSVAHSIYTTHKCCSFDLYKGESPFLTLRPTYVKSAIKEILWIYQDQSNDLELLKNKYNITWWDNWDLGDRTIGACYGETVRRGNLIDNLICSIQEDPYSRRHILSLWNTNDFKEPHGLKPCCYETIWTVVNRDGIEYLDMVLIQRSSDFIVAGAINVIQYVALLNMICSEVDMIPGKFTWFINNVHIYDRHIESAKELLNRESYMFDIDKQPKLIIPKKDFYDYTIDDFIIDNYPIEEIKKQNPQLKFELAI